MLELINAKKEEFYQEAQMVLLDPKSYTKEVDTSFMSMYLDFLNQALEDVEYRLASLETFLRDVDGLMVSQMYPFAFLKVEVHDRILRFYGQVVKLRECYEILSTLYEESLD